MFLKLKVCSVNKKNIKRAIRENFKRQNRIYWPRYYCNSKTASLDMTTLQIQIVLSMYDKIAKNFEIKKLSNDRVG